MAAFKTIAAEAAEYSIAIIQSADRIQFLTSKGTVTAWMFRDNGIWRGYTEAPNVTGKKRGTKGEVANWCLDWAANGF